MARELVQFTSGASVPNANRSVFACRGHSSAVGRVGDGEDGSGVSAQDVDLFFGGQRPYADRAVPTARRDEPAIRRNRDGVHWAIMSLPRLELLAGNRIPEANDLIHT